MEIKKRPNQKVILRKNGSVKIATINEEPSMTQQQFKESSDVNNILKNYMSTGHLPVSHKVAQFMDVSNIQDYQSSLQTVYEAQKAFDALPSDVRSRFENDPNQLIAFLEDASNLQEAQKLGLVDIKTNELNEQKQSTPPSQSASPSASVPS